MWTGVSGYAPWAIACTLGLELALRATNAVPRHVPWVGLPLLLLLAMRALAPRREVVFDLNQRVIRLTPKGFLKNHAPRVISFADVQGLELRDTPDTRELVLRLANGAVPLLELARYYANEEAFRELSAVLGTQQSTPA